MPSRRRSRSAASTRSRRKSRRNSRKSGQRKRRSNAVLYVSTRGGGEPQRFSGILLEGLAPDGGLYLPRELPRLDLGSLRKKTYVDLAKAILALFMDRSEERRV